MTHPLQDLQPISRRVWEEKYALTDADGRRLEKTPADSLLRVAAALSKTDDERDTFYDTMTAGCFPGGRIIANAGAESVKPGASLINCTVLPCPEDSIDGIMSAARNVALTLKAGCGIGINFSTLRPRGWRVNGPGASTTGPIPFMNIFDATCKTIASAGGRRGAMMGMLHARHPDIVEFITAKRSAGMLTQFNLSVLIPDDFMEAVKNGQKWQTRFPVDGQSWSAGPSYDAREIWGLLIKNATEHGEPGVHFIDISNHDNPLSGCEDLAATNPCGEVPLPENGACLLGSIALHRFLSNTSTGLHFDFGELTRHAEVFHEMLDRVVDQANLPLPGYQHELALKRRHGVGIMGLGTALNLMGVRYGSGQAVEILDRIMESIASAGVRVALSGGPEAPFFREMPRAHGQFRRFWHDRFAPAGNQSMEMLLHEAAFDGVGPRYTHCMSIAPTGTLALAFGNNCSNGMEPSFAHQYTRNLTVEGRRTRLPVIVRSAEALIAPDRIHEFVDAGSLSPDDHLAMQIIAQKWTDQSISKTINLPSSAGEADVAAVLMEAWERRCKGVTVYRPNPVRGSILATADQLSAQEFEFEAGDGTTVKLRGDQMMEYDGEVSTAAEWAAYFGKVGAGG